MRQAGARPGRASSYGHEYHTERDTTLALVPLGYADGVPRSASNRGRDAGRPAVAGRIAGRVCMDQFVVDLGDGPDAAAARPGDDVVLFGAGARRRADGAGLGRGGRDHLLRDRHPDRLAGAARATSAGRHERDPHAGPGRGRPGRRRRRRRARPGRRAGRRRPDPGRRGRRRSPGSRRTASLRGRPRSVVTADGTELHVEVDEPAAASGTAAERRRARCRPSSSPTASRSTWTPGTSSGRRCAGTTGWCSGTSAATAARRPGRAGSSTIEPIGADLARVIDVVAPNGPLVLVGHSMGGMTIMSLADAARRPGPRAGASRSPSSRPARAGWPTCPWARNQLVSRVAHRMAPSALSVLARRPGAGRRGPASSGSDLEQVLVRRYSFASPVPASLVRFAAEMIASTRIEVVADFLPGVRPARRPRGARRRCSTSRCWSSAGPRTR